MANSDRDIRIVPDRGASTQPVMYFTGADSLSSATIVLRVLNSSTDATLSFEGDVGQLFSITDSTFGPVFSVNDVSGIPSIEVLDSGLVKLAEWNGKVQVGGATNNENATSATTGELQVIGGVGVSRDVYVAGGMTVVGTLNAAVIAGSISNSANVGVTNDPSNSAAQYLTFVSGTSGNLPIKVDASALTFIPSTNNLGIGTTTPYSRLSLVSSANTEGISLFTSAYEAGRQWGHRIWKNDTGGGIPLQIDAQETTTWYTTVRMSHGQNNNHPALITYYNTQLAMTSGNVGVGITPTNKLHVSGDSKVAGTLVGLRNYQSGDDFRIDFVKAANDTASARFEWNGYSDAATHLIDYFSIGLNDASSAMQTRFQIMQNGRIGLNTTDFSYTSSDNTAVVAGGIDDNRVFVNGSIQLIGNNNAIVFGRGTSSFFKDEEIGFGWGGGWYMTDTTYLRSRNNKHIYNEAPYSGSRFQNFSTSYNAPNIFMPRWEDTNFAFGMSSNDSSIYWMQAKYYGIGNDTRGFRVLDSNSGAVRMSVADKITTHQNTFYRTFQGYTGSDNGPMKTWDGVLTAGSDNSGANTYTVIETNVPQDSYMMGGFSINWFENYSSTNAKTRIDIAGYWNPTSNGGHIGFEYTSSNPNIAPTIQVGRNIATGKTVFVLTHFSSNYAIVVARDLWLGYSGGDYDYGSGWGILQTGSLAAYSNLVSVVARVAQPAGSGSGSGLNADLLDGIDSTGFVRSNAATSGYINIDGGSQNSPTDGTVYITATNNNDWGLIVNKYNSSATEYGVDIRMGSAAAYALRVNGNGAEKMRINGEGHIFAPIYYDYNNNAYYGDFASTSNINALQTAGQVVIGGTFSATAHSNLTAARLMFSGGDGDAQGNYYIGTNAENYGGNYNKLDLRWHTGIRMGAQPGYGGIRFYDTEDLGTQIFAIGKDGSYAQANQSMRAPIFYDLDDTNYYVDANSNSRLVNLGLGGVTPDVRLSVSGDGHFSNIVYLGGTAGVANSWGSRDYTTSGLRYFNARNYQFNNFGYGSTYTIDIDTSGNLIASASVRAPIFYDSNNTAFYADPASTSRFNAIIANSINIPGTGGGSSNEYVFNCTASATQARRFEIARIGIDYNDWNSVGGFEVELHENYYGSGIIKKYTVYYGYVSNFGVHLTHYSGSGSNHFQVTTSGENTVSGDHRYISVFVDVRYYSGATAIVRTTRSITTSNPPGVGQTFIFSSPTITNIADFSADSTVFIPTTVQSSNDFRAPIFYDSNDTTYYVDPNSTSYQRSLFLGAHDSGASEFRFGEDSSSWYGDRWYWDSAYNVYRYSRYAGSDSLIHYHDTRDASRITYGRNIVFDDYGKGIVGNYDSTRLQAVFAMGDSYKMATNGAATNNMYGLAWSHPNAGSLGGANNLNDHGLLLINNGSFRAAISSRAVFSADVRGTLFYDYNNTGYYVDPASVSNLNNVLMLSAVSNNNNGLRNVMPGGGSYVTGASSVTGAIVITLPQTVFPMIRFTVKVYTYDGLSFDINCGGHTSGGTWYNTFAYMTTQNRPALNVRFTYGSGQVYVYIGELGTTWSYPQVFITDVQVGYTNYEYDRWDDGWSIGFNSSTYNNVSATQTVYPPQTTSNNSNAAYASIYYDSNNTAFFADPNSRSRLSSIDYGDGNYYFAGGDWGWRHNTPYGWIQFGPANSSHAHIYTSLSNFYFNAQIQVNGGSNINTNDIRANIFYDNQNTGYYLDPTSTTALRTVGSWRSDSSSWDGEFSGKMQYHSNHWYIQAADLFIYRNSGGSNVFTINQSGSAIANADMRAPIFYDNNDTSYYTDPNSTSRLYSLTVQNTINFPTSSGASSSRGGPAYNIYQEAGGWGSPFPDLNIAFHTGLSFGANPSYEGMRFFTDYDLSSRVMQVNGSSNYIYMDRWVNVAGNQGIYSGTNGAHFYPNNGDYGSWRIDGTRNGWHGIYFASGSTLMMNDGDGGIHRSGNGWRIYHSGNDLYARGEITAYWSDRRLKKNIKPLEKGSGLALVDRLVPSSFEWNELATKVNDGFYEGQPETALIAQEVQEILPIAVAENKAGRKAGKDSSIESYLTVKYDKITPFLIQAIKDLKAEIEELREIIRNGSN
jgi:hypothetical protein